MSASGFLPLFDERNRTGATAPAALNFIAPRISLAAKNGCRGVGVLFAHDLIRKPVSTFRDHAR
jgi:hypothetical protein